jgi:hypothetical protein
VRGCMSLAIGTRRMASGLKACIFFLDICGDGMVGPLADVCRRIGDDSEILTFLKVGSLYQANGNVLWQRIRVERALLDDEYMCMWVTTVPKGTASVNHTYQFQGERYRDGLR